MTGVIHASSEIFVDWWVQMPDFVTVMVVSIGCGLVIGLERESRGKVAGARTLVLICLGSAIFAQISVMMSGTYGDPARIAAQIVSGIGFLGAGAILQQSERGYIAGLTTAATIWVTAAVGIVVGAGYYIYAIVSMIFIVCSLRLLRVVEKKLFHTRNIEKKIVRFHKNLGKTEWKLLGLLEDHMLQPGDYHFRKLETAGEDSELEILYNKQNRSHRSFLAEAAAMKSVVEIRAGS